MDRRLMDAFLDGLIPCFSSCYAASVASAGNGVIYERLSGNRKIEPEHAFVCLDTLFDLDSLTTFFIATALLRTLDDGKVSLEATLSDFFPACGNYPTVTVRQLATHTAGFAPEIRLLEQVKDPSDALPFIFHASPLLEPGAAPFPSCFGFIVLGRVLETIWKKPLDEVMVSLVTEPLGMRHTWYNPKKHGETMFAETVDEDGCFRDGVVNDVNARFLGGVSGNAGLFSTLEDMECFVVGILRPGFLAPSSVSLLERLGSVWVGRTGVSLTLDYGSGKGALLLANRMHLSDDDEVSRHFASLAFS